MPVKRRVQSHKLRRITLTPTEENYEALERAGHSVDEIAAITGRKPMSVRVALLQCKEKRRDLENLAQVNGKPA